MSHRFKAPKVIKSRVMTLRDLAKAAKEPSDLHRYLDEIPPQLHHQFLTEIQPHLDFPIEIEVVGEHATI